MPAERPRASEHVYATAGGNLGYGLQFLRRHGWRILTLFVGLLLPLSILAALVEDLRESEVFFFDAPLLSAAHQLATPAMDSFFVLVSKLGYAWGVIPLDIGLFAWLVFRRRKGDGLFFGLAVLGSMLLNIAAKQHFSRIRPQLWLSVAPETSFSFPSGHAMGSATLGVALCFLFWPTRWRWPVIVASAMFVVLVGFSRIYLGVHYPSDVLGGWAAGTAWAVAVHQLVVKRAPPP
jgi:membrane-associated phospholipid phosphatase